MERAMVLVIDDTPENLDVLVGILGSEYQVKVATSGKKGLEIAGSETPPDLILLDVMMPGINGFEVCRRLKSDKKTADIPVIFVTALTDTIDEEKGLEIGAIDYLTKPVNPGIVKIRVHNHITLQRTKNELAQLTDKLARYISPQISRSISDGTRDTQLVTQRKKLTVFFSDIVGFTSMSESLEPEDLTFLLNNYLNEMTKIVLKHGGTLDKFIGDAVFVFFGDPYTKGVHEDARVCVEMALEMKETILAMEIESRERGIQHPLRVRMGISTGYCTVGNFGSEERMDYTIMGRHVNLASRVEKAAEPGEILISKETWTLVNPYVHCVQREPIMAKGFADPIGVFQVSGKDAISTGDKLAAAYPGFTLNLKLEEIEDRKIVLEFLRKAIANLEK